MMTANSHLASDCIEQCVHNTLREPPLLVLVHLHYLPPVGSHLWKMTALTQVYQIKDILLEARASETDAGFEELGPNTRVVADRVGDLIDIRACGFADGREGVDRRDALGKHGVCCQF